MVEHFNAAEAQPIEYTESEDSNTEGYNTKRGFSNLAKDLECKAVEDVEKIEDKFDVSKLLPGNDNGWGECDVLSNTKGILPVTSLGLPHPSVSVNKNPNLQLRSEIPNTKTAVSPFLNSTIDGDNNRPSLELS